MSEFPENTLPEKGEGRCLCSAVRFEWTAKPDWACICHCDSCRRAHNADYGSFFGVNDANWRWPGAEPKLYESSPGVRRYFCGDCGSPMAAAADKFPGETHFYAASLTNPRDFRPTFEVHVSERLPWVRAFPDLPQHGGHSV